MDVITARAYRIQVRHACEDLDTLRRRLSELQGDIERQLADLSAQEGG